ncbi:Napsin-A [Aphelenchoides besseyi]|nr:Napsin-A [Aphelenchoides besseyi]
MSSRFLFVLLVLTSSTCANAKSIEWPFSSDFNLLVNVTIGTPGQSLPLVLWADTFNDLLVVDTRIGGNFDPSASSTFVVNGDCPNYDGTGIMGVTGTDKFQFGNVVVEKLETFNVVTNSSYQFFGHVGLAHSTNNSKTFIDSLLNDFEKKVVTFSFDSLGLLTSTGLLSIGSRLADRCADDWNLVPEYPYFDWTAEQWGVKIDSLTIGKYSYDSPGQAQMTLGVENDLQVPLSYMDWIRKALNAKQKDVVDCEIQTEIVFTIGNRDLRLQPDDYVNRLEQKETGRCYVNFQESVGVNNFVLPSGYLTRYCVLHDYAGLNVGFSTRLPH